MEKGFLSKAYEKSGLGVDRLQSYLGRFNPVMPARLKLVYISLRIIREILGDRNIKPYKRLNKVSGS